MGPYLVFMASTISGYEGTGRSLSLKLIKQLREQSRTGAAPNAGGAIEVDRSSGRATKETGMQGGRSLKEITLSEPIRYAQGDAVEKWLNTLLCLDATLPRSKLSTQGCPVSILFSGPRSRMPRTRQLTRVIGSLPVRAAPRQPRYPLLLPPGVRKVPPANGRSLCRQSLQELAQRLATYERCACSRAFRPYRPHRRGPSS